MYGSDIRNANDGNVFKICLIFFQRYWMFLWDNINFFVKFLRPLFLGVNCNYNLFALFLGEIYIYLVKCQYLHDNTITIATMYFQTSNKLTVCLTSCLDC